MKTTTFCQRKGQAATLPGSGLEEAVERGAVHNRQLQGTANGWAGAVTSTLDTPSRRQMQIIELIFDNERGGFTFVKPRRKRQKIGGNELKFASKSIHVPWLWRLSVSRAPEAALPQTTRSPPGSVSGISSSVFSRAFSWREARRSPARNSPLILTSQWTVTETQGLPPLWLPCWALFLPHPGKASYFLRKIPRFHSGFNCT